MALHGKKPLRGRNYYFDLRFYRNQDDLIKDVKKLGGKVESFLGKEVTHVVTDRYFKSKLQNFAPMTPKSLLSISSPMNDSYTDLWGTQSPLPDGPAVSRGQAILQKAMQKNKGSSNILNFCNQWDIKVSPLQKLLDFISRCKTWVKNTRENKTPREKTSFKFQQFRQVLNAPFMKVENKNRNFKPFFKEFNSIKDCFNHTAWRVHNRIQKQLAQTDNLVLKSSQMQNILASTSSSKFATSKAGSQNTVNFSRAHPSNSLNLKKNVGVRDKNKKKGSKKVTDKKRFCEICSVSFLHIKEHLLAPKHKYFMSNPKNYEIIEEIIQSSPTAEDFLKKAFSSSTPSATITKEINSSGISAASICDSVTDDAKENGNVTKDLSQSTDKTEIIPASCETEECPNSFPCLNCDLLQKLTPEFRLPDGEKIVHNASSLPLIAKPFIDGSKISNILAKDSLFCYESIEQPSDNNSLPVRMGINCIDPWNDVSLESGNKFKQYVADISPVMNETTVSKPELHLLFDDGNDDDLLRREHRFFYGNSDDFSEESDDYVATYDNVEPKSKRLKLCSSSEPGKFDEILNIHGCLIPKYPFRNFGCCTVPAGPVEASLAADVKTVGGIHQQDENEQPAHGFYKDDLNLENEAMELIVSELPDLEGIENVNIMSNSEFFPF